MGLMFSSVPKRAITERRGTLKRFLKSSGPECSDILGFLTLKEMAVAEIAICDKLDLNNVFLGEITGPFNECDHYFHDALWAKKRGLLVEECDSFLSIEGLARKDYLWWLVRQIPRYPHYIELVQDIIEDHVCKYGIEEVTVKSIVERSLTCPAHLELGLTLIRLHEDKKINLLIDTIPAPSILGCTYLVHYAAFYGNIAFLRAIPDDSEMLIASNFQSQSPLIVAIQNAQVESVQFLSSRVDVNERPYKKPPASMFSGKWYWTDKAEMTASYDERHASMFSGKWHWADKAEMTASYDERYAERCEKSALSIAMGGPDNEIKEIILSHNKDGGLLH